MKSRRAIVATTAVLIGAAIVVALVTGILWFLGSDAALRWASGEAVARSGGKLKLEGVSGSLGSTMRIARVTYADSDFTLTADDVALTWSPRALLSKHVIVNDLSATHVDLTSKPGTGASPPLPASLALPWPVEIEHANIAAIDIVSGPNRWRVSHVGFHYAGGRERHELGDVSLDSEWGAVRGGLSIAAAKPFGAKGNLTFDASARLERAVAKLTIDGDLTTLKLTGDASALDASASGSANIAPFEARWLRAAEFKISGLDLARFDTSLPRTSLVGTIDRISQSQGRFDGHLALDNAAAGPWSEHKMPIVALTSTWTSDSAGIALNNIDATLVSAGSATGGVRFGGEVVQWNLALRGVDLHGIVADLKPTHLAGAVTGRLDLAAPRLEGEASGRLDQDGVALAFDAAIRDGTVMLRRFVARAHGGSMLGSATLATTGDRAFTLHADAVALDPAQFGAYPPALLTGKLDAHGVLDPQWSATLAFKLAPSCRFRGLALTGNGSLVASASRVHDAKLELAVGSNRLHLSGDLGAARDQMDFALDALDLAAIDARIGGQLHATGRIGGTWDRPTLTFDANGGALRANKQFSAVTLAASGEIGSASGAPTDRPIQLKIAATGLVVETFTLRSVNATITGTVAHHTASIAVAGNEAKGPFDANARIDGGWSGPLTSGHWSGQVLALESHGAYPFALAEAAKLDISRDRVQLDGARGSFAGGRFAVDELRWEQGRLSSRGAFDGLPATPLLDLAGFGAKLASTLTVRGSWAITATPRLNGTLTIAREGGDVAPKDSPQLLLGLAQADLHAEFLDDRMHATLVARSRYADVNVVADLGAGQPGGHFGEGAPLQLTAHFGTVSLRELQAFAGTSALIDGQLKFDLSGRGTLDRVRLSGNIEGDSLKLESPQYGVYLKDGKLRATLSEETVTVSEFSFAAGTGRFVASGTMPAAGEGDIAGTHLTWKADKLALFNRPDTKLTLSGAGTLALKDKTVVLAGAIRADEGYFEFQPSRAVVLGDDVVVRGRNEAALRPGRVATQRIPFAVDLTLDFGDRLQFVGEGFNTALSGKLAVRTTADQQLVANGTISATRGTYTAFGQVLAIQRGELYFNGPLDNPGLDIFALRKNLPVEAGVEVTGSVRFPNVQLTSNPPVPDNEKLAWLVLGHGLDTTNGADTAVLQAALAALGGSNTAGFGQRIARTFGIDDISFRAAQTSAAASGATTSGQVIAFTKQLSDRVSLIYEQGLSVANNALKIEYALSRSVTIRAEAGVVSGIGIYYSRSYK